jgi:pSer/pThr/pTyr-binding forkhead associated (FHA) protein
MNDTHNPPMLAKLTWVDPVSEAIKTHILLEGATVTLGRSSENDIAILDKHVSRRHAVIRYHDGVFTIADLGSVNGTFVNNRQVIEPFPLFFGDQIRLYVPLLTYTSATPLEAQLAQEMGNITGGMASIGRGKLIITTGAQEGLVVPLVLDSILIGRAVSNATWEISLQDTAVSRPHARLQRVADGWVVMDMGSVNGTLLNNNFLTPQTPYALHDGDILVIGQTTLLYRAG